MKRIIDAPGAAPTLFPSTDLSAFLAYVRGVWDSTKARNPTWMGPTLTLEFKRLDNKTSLRQKYFADGVARFVSGKYAPAHDTAMMVGLVEGSAATEKAGLLKYLSRPATKAALGLQPMSHSEYGDPSQDTPSVDFDTLHARAASCSCPQIRVGHILLER